MSPQLAVIAACELLLFLRITVSLLLDSGPAHLAVTYMIKNILKGISKIYSAC